MMRNHPANGADCCHGPPIQQSSPWVGDGLFTADGAVKSCGPWEKHNQGHPDCVQPENGPIKISHHIENLIVFQPQNRYDHKAEAKRGVERNCCQSCQIDSPFGFDANQVRAAGDTTAHTASVKRSTIERFFSISEMTLVLVAHTSLVVILINQRPGELRQSSMVALLLGAWLADASVPSVGTSRLQISPGC